MKSFIIMVCMAVLLTLANTGYAKPEGILTGKVNVNTATQEQLMMIPGIGAAKAQAIISQRETKKFNTVEELIVVKGIGEKLLNKMLNHVSTTGENDIRYEKSAAAYSAAKK